MDGGSGKGGDGWGERVGWGICVLGVGVVGLGISSVFASVGFNSWMGYCSSTLGVWPYGKPGGGGVLVGFGILEGYSTSTHACGHRWLFLMVTLSFCCLGSTTEKPFLRLCI